MRCVQIPNVPCRAGENRVDVIVISDRPTSEKRTSQAPWTQVRRHASQSIEPFFRAFDRSWSLCTTDRKNEVSNKKIRNRSLKSNSQPPSLNTCYTGDSALRQIEYRAFIGIFCIIQWTWLKLMWLKLVSDASLNNISWPIRILIKLCLLMYSTSRIETLMALPYRMMVPSILFSPRGVLCVV